jgi:hypothetical protein
MATEQLYRDRAEEARQKAEASRDPKERGLWLEIAQAYERFADEPPKGPIRPVWKVERLERKK